MFKKIIRNLKTEIKTEKGHANSASYGQDIVCAGVSAVIQTTILGLQAIAEAYPQYVEVMESKSFKRRLEEDENGNKED